MTGFYQRRRESLHLGPGQESSSTYQTSDPGGTMQLLSWLQNTGPALDQWVWTWRHAIMSLRYMSAWAHHWNHCPSLSNCCETLLHITSNKLDLLGGVLTCTKCCERFYHWAVRTACFCKYKPYISNVCLKFQYLLWFKTNCLLPSPTIFEHAVVWTNHANKHSPL